eukprot:TRINITY_DN7777_c1_g1_i3.p1 TRINITY_DN7777_c1_g1~~TRINITY_DN7777_c1_g1_i3.p1  ORF type:complete len:807 (+),score=223.60 TRINITY_DN7777_c1_g1_i3:106-2421(+)
MRRTAWHAFSRTAAAAAGSGEASSEGLGSKPDSEVTGGELESPAAGAGDVKQPGKAGPVVSPLRKHLDMNYEVWEDVKQWKELPNTESVAHTLLKIRLFRRLLDSAKEDEAVRLKDGIARLKSKIQDKNISNLEQRCTPSESTVESDRGNLLIVLRYALRYGGFTQMTYEWLMGDIISVYGLQGLEAPFLVDLLTRTRLMNPDENLILTANERSLVPPDWMADVEVVEEDIPDDCSPFREDIKDRMYAIDDPSTFEVDDAISVNGDGWYSVHVADVSRYLPYDSGIREAAQRSSTTVYFPEVVFTMLPRPVVEVATLKSAPEESLCCSVRFRLAEDGTPIEQQVYVGRSKQCYRLTYEQVNCILRQSGKEGYDECPSVSLPDWYDEGIDGAAVKELDRMARVLRSRRFEKGALFITRPEWWPKVTKVEESDSSPAGLEDDGSDESLANMLNTSAYDIEVVERVNYAFDSRKIVEEFMLMANHNVAQYCEDNDVPCPFRVTPNQAEETDGLGFAKTVDAGVFVEPHSDLSETQVTPEALFEQGTRKLKSQKAAFYSSLNIGHVAVQTGYCHFTSPLRRYPDLLVHYTVKDHLVKKHLLTEAQKSGGSSAISEVDAEYSNVLRRTLPGVCQRVSGVSNKKKKMMQNSKDVWLLRHIERQLAEDPEKVFDVYIGVTHLVAGSVEHIIDKGDHTHCSTVVLCGYGLHAKTYHSGRFLEGMRAKARLANVCAHTLSLEFELIEPDTPAGAESAAEDTTTVEAGGPDVPVSVSAGAA